MINNVSKIVNNEQHEFWNKGIGQKWVKEDNSMNERFTILTKEFFVKNNINKNDKFRYWLWRRYYIF